MITKLRIKNIFRIGIFIAFCFCIFTLTGFKTNAVINNTLNYQGKLVLKNSGINTNSAFTPCIVAGADTCDFRIRIWNHPTNTDITPTSGNLMYEELINDVEIGANNNTFNLRINSVCSATANSTSTWGTTVASASVCNLIDDSDADSLAGVNFDRDDLYLELTIDTNGLWTSLASVPGSIEIFSRINLRSAPSAFVAQTLSGISAEGFVQLSPSSVQNTTSLTGAIRVNQQGSGDLLQLQQNGTDKMVVTNYGQLQLSQTGSTGGLLLSGDTNLYRSAADVLRTDDTLDIVGDLSITGLSNFQGNLKNLVTRGDGSSSTNNAGLNTRSIPVSSNVNFDVGNLVLVNDTLWAKIDQLVGTSRIIVSPVVSFSNGPPIVEYIPVKIGGTGLTPQRQMDIGYFNNGITAGGDTTNGTVYGDQSVSSKLGLKFAVSGNGIDLNSKNNVNISTTNGLIINKANKSNVAASWSTPKQGGRIRAHGASGVYNGKFYMVGGADASTMLDTVDIYDFVTDTWSTGTPSGSPKGVVTSQIYNKNMYILMGCTNLACSSYVNTVDIYNLETDSWTTGTAGGTARAGAVSVLYGGRIYVWGGCNGGSCGTTLNTMDIYDIANNSWTTGVTGGTARVVANSVIYNRKMYVWAGLSGGVPINTMDVFDLLTNTWSTGTTGGTARIWSNAVVYDNKMYNWGGFNGTVNINTVDIFNFATNVWTTGVAGGTARNRTHMAIYNDRMYVHGGSLDAGTSFVATLEVMDFGINSNLLTIKNGVVEKLRFDTNNVLTLSGQPLGIRQIMNDQRLDGGTGWTTGTAGGTARVYHESVLYDGKIYNWSGCTATCTTIVTTMDIYDIATDTWSTGASGGTGRYGYVAAAWDGKIYYATGATNNAGTTVSTAVNIYNIALNSWTTGTSGGTGRSGASSVLYNGKIYIWAGRNAAGTNINTLDIYDIASATWTTGTAGGTARRFQKAIQYKGKMYNWGGFTTVALNTVDVYDLNTNTWSVGTAGGTARYQQTFTVYNDKAYGWSGCTNGACTTNLNTLDVYDFTRGAWITGTGTGGTTRGQAAAAFFLGKIYAWGGTTNGTTPLNTLDIFTVGVNPSRDIFYIANGQGVGPDDGKLFRFDATGRAYTSKQGGWFSVGADYAEYMYTKDVTLEPGEIVKLDPEVTEVSGGGIKRVEKARDTNTLGVISTEPGFVGNIVSIDNMINNDPNWKLLSMVGQVPVKVNTENGEIKAGDRITSSSRAGEGMKADEGDTNIGIAQEGYNDETKSGIIKVMITRNNEGINNKVEIKLGEEGEAGFRVKDGRLQYKDKNEEWENINKDVDIDSGVIWNKINEDIYANVDENDKVVVGVDEANQTDSRLQVDGGISDIGVKGLRYVKLNGSSNKIEIGGAEIGIRLSEGGALQYRDSSTNEWLSLNGMVRAKEGTRQITGWGFVEINGTEDLTEIVEFTETFKTKPIVNFRVVGKSSVPPESLNQCTEKSVNVTSGVSDVTHTNFKFNLKVPVEGSFYYCYTWLVN